MANLRYKSVLGTVTDACDVVGGHRRHNAHLEGHEGELEFELIAGVPYPRSSSGHCWHELQTFRSSIECSIVAPWSIFKCSLLS